VYGRDGEPCYVCGEIIDKVVIRARSTHFCPECQRG
jgi:formamidopyrimidine-DNA glycosylase